MDLILGIFSAYAEASDVVDAVQAGSETVVTLSESAEAIVATNDVYTIYRQRSNTSTSSSLTTTSAAVTSSSTRSVNNTVTSAATIKVVWTNPYLAYTFGKCHVPEKYLTKSSTGSFKTNCDLTFGQYGTVPKGSLCKSV